LSPPVSVFPPPTFHMKSSCESNSSALFSLIGQISSIEVRSLVPLSTKILPQVLEPHSTVCPVHRHSIYSTVYVDVCTYCTASYFTIFHVIFIDMIFGIQIYCFLERALSFSLSLMYVLILSSHFLHNYIISGKHFLHPEKEGALSHVVQFIL
jgi:hypothetical protein